MANKKLIEVALPLEAINTASAREKSIRHGHPSTLHLWWARRPLAAARAVIWASLVDDPSSHPEQFPTEEEQNTERQRLFRILEDLVVWENSNNQEVLEAAKAEIMKSTNNNPPALLDPFAGGGAIPLEAQRMGLEAHAHDLNPVAVMINKAMIEIPPKFAELAPVNQDSRVSSSSEGWIGTKGLAEDIKYYGEWVKKKALKEIGGLYPQIEIPKEKGGGKATVIAWLWTRTVNCSNPACRCEMPLASSYIISKKKGNEVWVEPEYQGGRLHFKMHYGKCLKGKESAKIGRSALFKCPVCGDTTTDAYVKMNGKLNYMNVRLMAIVAEGKNGRVYCAPNTEHELMARVDQPDRSPNGSIPRNPRWFSPPAFGMENYTDLFTDRQLTALCTFSSMIKDVQKQVTKDAVLAGMRNDYVGLLDGGAGATAYGQAIGVYLSFALDKAINIWSSLCGWMNDRGAFRETFSRQAMPMVWDFAEANPFSSSAGNFSMFVERCADAVAYLPKCNSGFASQADAQTDCGMRKVMISTDPPYYDNIGYADLSDYFYIWLRQSLKEIYPELFQTMLVPKNEELIATPFRHDGSTEKAKTFFENGMWKTCKQIYLYARDDIPVTIYYAYRQSDYSADDGKTASSGWETMLTAIIEAGFTLTGTWPVRTESPGRSIAQGTNALASSIVLVCRKRPESAQVCTRRGFISELKRELRPALQKLQASNIAPVDLAQSAIGPGMGVFSRFSKVLEADGTPMTVRSALQIINQELDIYFNEQDGELDRESRFCVELYTQYAFNDVKFGDADTLARAKNTSVLALATCGVMYAQQGTVHLYGRDELSDKALNNDSIIWLLTQQLTKAMETGGIEACARIVAPMLGSNAEYAKSLAYRLYTIAERKGWAQEAYAYNSLVIAWSDIQSRAAQIQTYEPEQLDLFSFINTKEENDG